MGLLLKFARWEIWILLLGLAGVVAVQILTGKINSKSLLHGSASGVLKDGSISPARVQLLISTLGLAFSYLVQVTTNPTPGTLPPVPDSWPAILGGSHAIYLGNKAYTRWFGNTSGK